MINKKKCPFCGGTPDYYMQQVKQEDDSYLYYPTVYCRKCGANVMGEECKTKREATALLHTAIELWEERVIDNGEITGRVCEECHKAKHRSKKHG